MAGVMLRGAPAGDASEGATPGWIAVDPRAPLVAGDDLGVTRGDGVFEAIGVFGGTPMELEAHLDRLARSAAAMDLDVPAGGRIAEGVAAAIAVHPRRDELLVKVYLTRGVPAGPTTVWIHALPNDDHSRARRDGLDVVLLDRGVARGGGAAAPWQLSGVKTLSYAGNRAALREAARRGADDAVYVTTDGYLLEGQSSTLVLLRGEHWITPPSEDGLLSGTTQRRLFRGLAAAGSVVEERSVVTGELMVADGAWLCSSGRLIAPIRSVDGAPVRWSPDGSAALWGALGLDPVRVGGRASGDLYSVYSSEEDGS